MEIVNIRLDAIELGERLRCVDVAHAVGIAESWREVGQMTPIEVRPADAGGRYLLISGAHRVEAARQLGETHIAARISDVADDDDARLREIDENLFRHDLTPLDRATFMAERKRLYELLHPQTRNGRNQKVKRNENLFVPSSAAFTTDTAKRLGMSRRHVELAVFRHAHIAADVRRQISGTALAAKGSELDALARLEADEQRAVVDAILDGRAGNVAGALRFVRGTDRAPVDVDGKQFVSLMGAWRRAGAAARGRFVAVLVAEGAVAPAETGKSSKRRVA
jgi:ParB family chromosome partitioning protein